MFSPLYHTATFGKTDSSKVENSSYYPLTPDEFDSKIHSRQNSTCFSSEDEFDMTNDDYLQQDQQPINTNDMVYFAIHRPTRFTAGDASVIQSIEPDSACYAIINSGTQDANTTDNATSSSHSTNRSVAHFKGSELSNMVEEYPDAIFYALLGPTWAEQNEIDDLFQRYPDAVVYSVPRPRHLVSRTSEPVHLMDTDQPES